MFDLVVGSVPLIVLSPVIAVVAAMVRVWLGRPVIFRQERPGLGGRLFTIYKFRTMLDTTDEQRHAPPERPAHTSIRSAPSGTQPGRAA